MALGRSPDYAINHDPVALGLHARNHPDTKHFCESIFDVDPVDVCVGRPVGLAWFSPDCTHFSRAKGGAPRKKKIRCLAWVVVRWAAAVRTRVIILENVAEFQTWGPLTAEGQPCKARQGDTFREWVGHLRHLGYVVEWRELVAADYGAPTSRKRFFLVARCDGKPVVWPAATHGPGRAKPYRTAAECIDWSIPCGSIFERKKPLAENTLKRIAAGLRRFVLEAPEPFIVSYYGEKRAFLIKYYGAKQGQSSSVGEPMHTLTSKARMGLVMVSGPLWEVVDIGLRMLQPRELARAQGFPDSYILEGTKTAQVAMIGNSVSPPCAEALVRANYAAASAAVRGVA